MPQFSPPASGSCLSAQASAADYPSRLIKIIVPSTAGSPNDTMARLLAQHLSPRLGQTIIIENKPGAGTAIGTRTVVAAEPNGYTLLFTSSAVIVETAVKKLEYDPVRDLTPIATVATTSWLITVAPSLPGNLAAFVGYTEVILERRTLPPRRAPRPLSSPSCSGRSATPTSGSSLTRAAWRCRIFSAAASGSTFRRRRP